MERELTDQQLQRAKAVSFAAARLKSLDGTKNWTAGDLLVVADWILDGGDVKLSEDSRLIPMPNRFPMNGSDSS